MAQTDPVLLFGSSHPLMTYRVFRSAPGDRERAVGASPIRGAATHIGPEPCDEAVALRDWAERNAASAFIIPSEIFSARRVRWIFCREFLGTAVSIEVPSIEPPHYTPSNWWKTERGLVAFQNEVLKYIYYRLKY
jgi:hypothetical protein